MKVKKLTNEKAAFTNFEGLCLSDSVNAVDLQCKDGDNLGEKGLSLFLQGILKSKSSWKSKIRGILKYTYAFYCLKHSRN